MGREAALCKAWDHEADVLRSKFSYGYSQMNARIEEPHGRSYSMPRRARRHQSAPSSDSPMKLVKSKQRVADHGEVFTPTWMVDAMLDLVKGETERIDAKFLEPACGSGNFLVPILKRKLAAVELKYGKSAFEKQQYALLALMCAYGIELLADNVAECRSNLLRVFAKYLKLTEGDALYRAAAHVLALNIVHADALSMCTPAKRPIVFAEWGYLGKGKFQRRDFRLRLRNRLVTQRVELGKRGQGPCVVPARARIRRRQHDAD